jgi:glycolate oxidase
MTDKTTFEVLHEFVAPARKKLSNETWDYLMGAAETETTHIRNRLAFDSVGFRPRVLRDVSAIDKRTRFLGHDLRLPVVLAPIGSLQDLAEGGGVMPTKAAAVFGVLHMLSSVCQPGLEQVAAAAPGYPKIFQLYVRGNPDWVDERVATAEQHGYAAVCFTVDLDYYGRRERDLAKRYKPSARRGHAVASAADPHQARFTWKDIQRIRARTGLPLIIKGIATAEDAVIAVEHGVEVVYVSNHGGRQLDHGKGALAVVPEVVDAIGRQADVMVDGGVMRGADIVKAMALGCKAVGIGRLQGLALAAAGEAGVVRMLELLEDEVERTMGMLGVTRFADLDGRSICSIDPLPRLGLDAAFPLLKEGY